MNNIDNLIPIILLSIVWIFLIVFVIFAIRKFKDWRLTVVCLLCIISMPLSFLGTYIIGGMDNPIEISENTLFCYLIAIMAVLFIGTVSLVIGVATGAMKKNWFFITLCSIIIVVVVANFLLRVPVS